MPEKALSCANGLLCKSLARKSPLRDVRRRRRALEIPKGDVDVRRTEAKGFTRSLRKDGFVTPMRDRRHERLRPAELRVDSSAIRRREKGYECRVVKPILNDFRMDLCAAERQPARRSASGLSRQSNPENSHPTPTVLDAGWDTACSHRLDDCNRLIQVRHEHGGQSEDEEVIVGVLPERRVHTSLLRGQYDNYELSAS